MIHIQSQHLEEREKKLKREEEVLNKLKDQLTKTIIADSSEANFFSSSSSLEPKPFLQKLKSEFSRLHRENQKFKEKLAKADEGAKSSRSKDDLERKVKNLKRELAASQLELAREKQENNDFVSVTFSFHHSVTH